jgi:hypothetical protein
MRSFSKLTRTVPLRIISALVVEKAFCEHWVFVYGPPRYLLTDNGTQFTAKCFLAVCRDLGIAKGVYDGLSSADKWTSRTV